MYYDYLGGGKASDSEDEEPAAKKKATPALVSLNSIIYTCKQSLDERQKCWVIKMYKDLLTL